MFAIASMGFAEAKNNSNPDLRMLRSEKCPGWLTKTLAAESMVLVGCQKLRVPQKAFLLVGYLEPAKGGVLPDRHQGLRLHRILVEGSSRSILSRSSALLSPDQPEYRIDVSSYTMRAVDLDNDRIDEVLEIFVEGHGGLYETSATLLTLHSKNAMKRQAIPGAMGMVEELVPDKKNDGRFKSICGGNVAIKAARKGKDTHLIVNYKVFFPQQASDECGTEFESRLWLRGDVLSEIPQARPPRPSANSSQIGTLCQSTRSCGPGEGCRSVVDGARKCLLNRP